MHTLDTIGVDLLVWLQIKPALIFSFSKKKTLANLLNGHSYFDHVSTLTWAKQQEGQKNEMNL